MQENENVGHAPNGHDKICHEPESLWRTSRGRHDNCSGAQRAAHNCRHSLSAFQLHSRPTLPNLFLNNGVRSSHCNNKPLDITAAFTRNMPSLTIYSSLLLCLTDFPLIFSSVSSLRCLNNRIILISLLRCVYL